MVIIEELIEKISKISKIPANELNKETLLYNSATISSLVLLELINHVEKKYNIVILPDDLFTDNFKDIQSLAGFIEEKQKVNV